MIKDVLEPTPTNEQVREMDTEDFERIMLEFGEISKKKNAEYKKKLSHS